MAERVIDWRVVERALADPSLTAAGSGAAMELLALIASGFEYGKSYELVVREVS
jgi:hypothetical protein